MADNNLYDIVVIGGGAAGIMAALRGVLNNDKVIVFPGAAKEKKKSRAQWVSKIENMPGYDHFKKGIVNPNKQTIEMVRNSAFSDNLVIHEGKSIFKIEKDDNEIFHLEDNDGNKHKAKFVVLSTGVMDVQPEIEGSIKPVLPYANIQLIDYCLRCDGHHVYGKETAIIGHTDSAAWTAIILFERYRTPNMTIITNGKTPEFSDDTKKLLELYKVDITEEKIIDIQGNPKEKVLEAFVLESGKLIYSDIAFVSLGMIVYNELAKQLNVELDDRGFVITNEKGETNVENLYAIGDLQANTKKQIYTAWDTAVDSLDNINAKIRKAKRDFLLSQN